MKLGIFLFSSKMSLTTCHDNLFSKMSGHFKSFPPVQIGPNVLASLLGELFTFQTLKDFVLFTSYKLRYRKESQGYKIIKPLLACWYWGIIPLAERLSSKFHSCSRGFASQPTVHFSGKYLSRIFQPWALPPIVKN